MPLKKADKDASGKGSVNKEDDETDYNPPIVKEADDSEDEDPIPTRRRARRGPPSARANPSDPYSEEAHMLASMHDTSPEEGEKLLVKTGRHWEAAVLRGSKRFRSDSSSNESTKTNSKRNRLVADKNILDNVLGPHREELTDSREDQYTSMEDFTSPEDINLRSIKDTIEALVFSNVRTPTPRDNSPIPQPRFTDALITGPVLHNRNCVVKLTDAKKDWGLIVNTTNGDPSHKKAFRGLIGNRDRFFCSRTQLSVTNQAAAIPIMNVAAQLANRWPYSIAGKGGTNRFWNTVFKICQNQGVETDRRLNAPTKEHEGSWSLKLPIFDTESQTNKDVRVYLRVFRVQGIKHSIPPLPPGLTFGRDDETYDEFVARVTSASNSAQETTIIHAMAYFAWKYQDCESDKDSIERLWEYHCAQWNISKGLGRFGKNGVYGGYALTSPNRNARLGTTQIRLGVNVYKDNPDVERHSIYVKSLKRQHVKWIEVEMEQVFVATASINKCLLAGYRLNHRHEQLRLAGEEPVIQGCNCTNPETSTTLHQCEHCLNWFECKSLSLSTLGLRVDARCNSNMPNVGFQTANKKIYDRRRREFKLRPMKAFEKQAIMDDIPLMESKIKKEVQPTYWNDGYCITDQSDGGLQRPYVELGSRKNPLALSADACFPVVWKEIFEKTNENERSLDETIEAKVHAVPFTHLSNNITFTSIAINYGKHTWAPAWLAYWSAFEKARKANGDQVTEQMIDEIVDEADQVHAAGLSLPHCSRNRGRGLDRKQRQWLLKLFQKGTYRKDDPRLKKMQENFCTWIQKLNVNEFKEEIDSITRVCQEMQKEMPEMKLQMAADGTPFPFHCPMPKWWNWNCMLSFLLVRLDRLRDRCNRGERTIDNIVTLCLTLALTFLRPSIGDSAFGLPFVPWTRHPLKVAFAHKVHGKPLQSGWRAPEGYGYPQSLTDWHDSLNNMSVEAGCANYAKSNFGNQVYDELRQIWAQISLPTQLFDPTIVLDDDVEFPYAGELTLEALREFDDFNTYDANYIHDEDDEDEEDDQEEVRSRDGSEKEKEFEENEANEQGEEDEDSEQDRGKNQEEEEDEEDDDDENAEEEEEERSDGMSASSTKEVLTRKQKEMLKQLTDDLQIPLPVASKLLRDSRYNLQVATNKYFADLDSGGNGSGLNDSQMQDIMDTRTARDDVDEDVDDDPVLSAFEALQESQKAREKKAARRVQQQCDALDKAIGGAKKALDKALRDAKEALREGGALDRADTEAKMKALSSMIKGKGKGKM